MYLKKTPKYPIRKWFGRYSAYTAVELNLNRWLHTSKAIEFFLRAFPRYRSLEHFTSADVADFQAVNPSAHLLPVQRFWEWLILKGGIPIRQIVLDPTRKIIKTKSNLGINDMLRLLDNCETIELKKRVIGAVNGGKPHIPETSKLWPEFQRASARARMLPGFRLNHLKVRVANRLGKDMVQAYCEKLLNALPPEAELSSDTFTAIQLSSLDERTPVPNSYNDLLPGSGIIE